MHVPAVNKARRTRNGEKEIEVHQSLAIIGYIALDNVKERILENEDSRSVLEQYVSLFGESGTRELFMAISGNLPKSERGK